MKQLKLYAEKHQLVGVFVAKEGHEKHLSDISHVEQFGVLCHVINSPGSHVVYFHAVKRIKITGKAENQDNPLIASIKEVTDEPIKEDKEYKALSAELLESTVSLIKMQESASPWPQMYFQPYHVLDQMQPAQYADVAAGRCLNASKTDLLEVLASTNVKERLNKVLTLVKQELEIFELKKNLSK